MLYFVFTPGIGWVSVTGELFVVLKEKASDPIIADLTNGMKFAEVSDTSDPVPPCHFASDN